MPGSAVAGARWYTERITSNTDTTVITAPTESRQAIRLDYVAIMPEVDPGNGDELIRLEDGVGGTVLATAIADMGAVILDFTGLKESDRPRLTAATLLNAETTGSGTATWLLRIRYKID